EHGLLFSANVLKGHKTGYFLDHRHNRKRIAELSAGKKVLDVFAYAGGFSVHALAGGASEVISIDISKQALQQAKQNAELNQVADKLQVMVVDAFKAMEQLIAEGRLFDIVVIDPPSFAKQAAEVAVAKKQYQRLATLGAALVKKQGILFLASCSARVSADDFYAWTAQSLEMAGIAYEVMEKTLQDIDHPIAFREGAYLKAVYYRILV
ncbi:MAG TPA: class I SAM-dependent rRNA methyltransferase, partial [Phaeodactylibacter sp.]|nr:class I SAM-dependent rRNA methyltransferase [Phaeodactylibacter sp.]